jgi:ABC-type antimicrobial peptide transport system ATPase subunit
MTRKERILNFIQKLPDDVSYDRVLYHVGVMKAIEAALIESERGEGIEHEELFRRLLKENEKNLINLATSRRKESRANKSKNSAGQTDGRRKIRQKS